MKLNNFQKKLCLILIFLISIYFIISVFFSNKKCGKEGYEDEDIVLDGTSNSKCVCKKPFKDINGVCGCEDGFKDINGECVDIECDEKSINCNNNGSCFKGECVCKNGYSGVNCENRNDYVRIYFQKDEFESFYIWRTAAQQGNGMPAFEPNGDFNNTIPIVYEGEGTNVTQAYPGGGEELGIQLQDIYYYQPEPNVGTPWQFIGKKGNSQTIDYFVGENIREVWLIYPNNSSEPQLYTNNPFCGNINEDCKNSSILCNSLCEVIGCADGYYNTSGDSTFNCVDKCDLSSENPEKVSCVNVAVESGVGEVVCSEGLCICPSGYTLSSDGTSCVLAPRELKDCDTFPSFTCSTADNGELSAAQKDYAMASRWQTPPRNYPIYYKNSYQDMSKLVGYLDVEYNDTRTYAKVTVITTVSSVLDGAVMWYTYSNSDSDVSDVSSESENDFYEATDVNAEQLYVKVVAKDTEGNQVAELKLPPVKFIWQNVEVANTVFSPYFEGGKKGSIVEFFMWPFIDVNAELQFLADAGYMGAKMWPVSEHVMSKQPFQNIMNPWYFAYQPVSYNLDCRQGKRQDLEKMVNNARAKGVRVYVDVVLNHFSGNGNDIMDHRDNNNGNCSYYPGKSTSANSKWRLSNESTDIFTADYDPTVVSPGTPVLKEYGESNWESPYFTQGNTYIYNINNNVTGGAPEFPGAALGPIHFHCDEGIQSWGDAEGISYQALESLVDLNSALDEVQDRQVAYMLDIISIGISGFRIDAAKHMKPEHVAQILGKLMSKLGGSFPPDFICWCEVLTGGEGSLWWGNEGSDGGGIWADNFTKLLSAQGITAENGELEKIKVWIDLYPKEFNKVKNKDYSLTPERWVIQLDDHDQQKGGSTSRDLQDSGAVLAKLPEKATDIGAHIDKHANFIVKMFNDHDGDNTVKRVKIRNILSSYWFTTSGSVDGVPDGLSSKNYCELTCDGNKNVPRAIPSDDFPQFCAFKNGSRGPAIDIDPIPSQSEMKVRYGWTRVHRTESIIKAMRSWLLRDKGDDVQGLINNPISYDYGENLADNISFEDNTTASNLSSNMKRNKKQTVAKTNYKSCENYVDTKYYNRYRNYRKY